jgi:hypothetical protein
LRANFRANFHASDSSELFDLRARPQSAVAAAEVPSLEQAVRG